MKKRNLARYYVTAALIAALYVCLTLLSSAFGLAYAGLQFRLSEALNILAALTPAAIPGLTLGCLISNLGSPFGPIDILLGTLATLLSAISIKLISKKQRRFNPVLYALPPALLNGLIVGFATVLFTVDDAKLTIFTITFIQVFIGEAVVMLTLGIALHKFYKSHLNNKL